MGFDEIVKRVLENGVVAGCLILVLYWILQRFSADMRGLSKQMQSNTLMLLFFAKQFHTHDAQVRGINPSTGDSKDERESLAYQEYIKLHEALDQTIDELRALRPRKK